MDEQSENKPHITILTAWQNHTIKSMCGLNLTTILIIILTDQTKKCSPDNVLYFDKPD